MPGPNKVTSTSSDRVSRIRALNTRIGRRKAGRFVVEGPQSIEGALRAGVRVHDLIVDETAADSFGDLMASAEAAGARTTLATPAVIAAMSDTAHPQGILAVCDLLVDADLAAAMSAPGPVVVLESIADPGNVGTVIRTADSVSAAAVILTPGSADVHSGKVVRSTAGSLFHLPVISGIAIEDVVSAARTASRPIAVASGDGDVSLFAAADDGRVDQRTCWIIGSEAHGVSEQARSAADHVVVIPMTGLAESLNAGVAAAVLLYVTRHAESRVHQHGERMTD